MRESEFSCIFEKLGETVVEKYLWQYLEHVDVAALFLVARFTGHVICGSDVLWRQFARSRFALEDAAVDAQESAFGRDGSRSSSSSLSEVTIPGSSGFDVTHHAVQVALLSAVKHPRHESGSFSAALIIYGDFRDMFLLRPRLRGDGVYAHFCRGVFYFWGMWALI